MYLAQVIFTALVAYRHVHVYVGPLTSFLDADKAVSSPKPSVIGSKGRGGVKFTDHELKVLRLVFQQP